MYGINLFIFVLINIIILIISENFNNAADKRSIIDLKIKGKDFQQILGSDLLPDLIYLNGNITIIDNSGKIFIESDNEINKVTLIWNQKINNCEFLFQFSSNITEIDLSNFDTSIVTSMISMFENCENLEYIRFGNINTSSVLYMSNMFSNCLSLLSLDLSKFDTSKVLYMQNMFYQCFLLTSLDITNFNTSKVETIESMFYGCQSLLELDLSSMDVSNVINMEYLFRECYSLTSLNLNNFYTPNAIYMKGLFVDCHSLEILDLSYLETSNAIDMSYMFCNCESLTFLNLTNFDTFLVENMECMFCQSSSLIYVDISTFDTTNVNNMKSMFFYCSALKSLDLSNFILNNVDMDQFLTLSTSLEFVKFPKDNPSYGTGYSMFSECLSLKSIELYEFTFLGDIGYLFSGCILLNSLDLSLVDTSYVTEFHYLFENCNSLKTINLSNWITSGVKSMNYMFYDCKSLISLDLSNFDTSLVTDMSNIFFNCRELTSLDLSIFNTSLVDNMNSMFYGCVSLKTLNLSNFNTFNVINMKSMFFNCGSLESLDLSNFITNNVQNMIMMFAGCLNLKFINFKNYKNELDILTANMFYRANNNLRIYMNNIKDENINNLIPQLSYSECITNNYSLIYKENLKINNDNRICLYECFNDEIYRYEYNGLCYKECPEGTYSHSSDTYLCELSQIKCIKEYPFLLLEDNSCTNYCNSEEFFNGKCTISNNNIESQSNLIINIINGIEDGSMDKLLVKYINDNKKDIIKEVNNTIYQITSSYNQKNIKYQSISSIDLGECEKIIKEKYFIPKNETLLIFKTEKYIEGLLIPFIEYEIFNQKNKEKINFNICNDRNINITFDIPVSINESILYKYDLNNSYYNDICNISIEENGIDITLYDRKNEYINNNLYLCTINCTYIGYNKENKTVTCLCQFRPGIILYTDINKDQILNLIINKKNKLNLNVMKCFNLLFSKEGLIFNLGNYMLSLMILLYIGSAIFFYFKGYDSLCNQINEILDEKNMETTNKLKIKQKIKENSIPKDEIKKKDNMNNDEIKLNIDFNLNVSNDSLESKKKIEIEDNKNKKSLSYLNNEINIFPYEKAIQKDKRTYFQYYKSLLLLNNIFFFSFYLNKDYNPYAIKNCIFFFVSSLNLVINALFFNDNIMHEIYKDKGIYNLIFFLPQIIYSVIITSIFASILKNIILTQRNILEIKHEQNVYNLKPKVITVLKCLIIKFVCFYIITFIFLIVFWYYISCFSIVYKYTQRHLIINLIISLAISFIYPFIFCLLPGILRIRSLKAPGKYLYNFSKIIQIL